MEESQRKNESLGSISISNLAFKHGLVYNDNIFIATSNSNARDNRVDTNGYWNQLPRYRLYFPESNHQQLDRKYLSLPRGQRS